MNKVEYNERVLGQYPRDARIGEEGWRDPKRATGGEGRGWTADEREARWRDGKNETEGKIDTGVGNKARGRTGVPGEGEGTMQRAEEGIRDRLS